ncbi:MAG: AraC family transcriptional regulator [Pseudoflavonifractor sp.]|nr:AraC family transcriptional regulator [Alloprevotella sp.]MCM1116233.1 AraC family transcriptional regulator [Pseudoflavonifractor sp.]
MDKKEKIARADEVDLRRLTALERFASEFSMLEDDYVFAHSRPGERCDEFERGPVRVKGMTIILVKQGRMEVEVNMQHYTLGPGMLLIVGHESIFHTLSADLSDLDIYTFFISTSFMRDINIDVGVLQTVKLSPNSEPVLHLSEEEERIVTGYLEMIHTNTTANSEPVYVRSISRCLMAAVVYQMMQFGRNHRQLDEPATPGMARRNNYVRDFIKLVHEHHRRERSVAFYASKLFISSKYLSMLVREASGRSAAEWIDDYVILEAKNLLRFSGKNIQQIAYELNFSNQSAFGKYFKHLTGMSPTEFQRS